MGSGDPGIPHSQDLSEPIPGLAPRRLGGHIMYRRDQGMGEGPSGSQPRSRDRSVLSAGDADLTWHVAGDLVWGQERPEVRAA